MYSSNTVFKGYLGYIHPAPVLCGYVNHLKYILAKFFKVSLSLFKAVGKQALYTLLLRTQIRTTFFEGKTFASAI